MQSLALLCGRLQNILLSSSARTGWEVRSPLELVHMAALFGLTRQQAQVGVRGEKEGKEGKKEGKKEEEEQGEEGEEKEERMQVDRAASRQCACSPELPANVDPLSAVAPTSVHNFCAYLLAHPSVHNDVCAQRLL